MKDQDLIKRFGVNIKKRSRKIKIKAGSQHQYQHNLQFAVCSIYR